MTKATAVAHTIQGLMKYHGLRNKKLRLPFHDSISVCVKELTTTATVDFNPQYTEDMIQINGAIAKGTEAQRVTVVVDALRKLKKTKDHVKIVSQNNLENVKGVGFSAAAFINRIRSKQISRLEDRPITLERDSTPRRRVCKQKPRRGFFHLVRKQERKVVRPAAG